MDEKKNEQAAQQTVELIDECLKREVVTPLHSIETSTEAEGIKKRMEMDKAFSESIDKAQSRSSHDNIVVSILKSMFSKK